MKSIDPKFLAQLIKHFEARIPEPTVQLSPLSSGQRRVNAGIKRDRDLIAAAKKFLQPCETSESWMTLTLEEMRFARDIAVKDGNTARAFALATAIDRKKLFYS